MAQKRFFGHISGTESPRTKIFALFGPSYMTGPGPSIKFFGVLGEYVELLNQLILTIRITLFLAVLYWNAFRVPAFRNAFRNGAERTGIRSGFCPERNRKLGIRSEFRGTERNAFRNNWNGVQH